MGLVEFSDATIVITVKDPLTKLPLNLLLYDGLACWLYQEGSDPFIKYSLNTTAGWGALTRPNGAIGELEVYLNRSAYANVKHGKNLLAMVGGYKNVVGAEGGKYQVLDVDILISMVEKSVAPGITIP